MRKFRWLDLHDLGWRPAELHGPGLALGWASVYFEPIAHKNSRRGSALVAVRR